MRIGILGASGFIGKHVTAALRQRGDTVVSASLREPAAAAQTLAGCDAVVNLAGEPIAQRWSSDVKKRIEESRTFAVSTFLDQLSAVAMIPKRYVSASAVGYYGTSETVTFTEESPAGSDFLARVCLGWEREAARASDLGMRVTCIRNGLALGNDGGALEKIIKPFRMGAGGRVGSGKQWYSWIHIDDLTGIYLMAIDGVDGALNATAPNPVTNSNFTKALGKALGRPTFFPVPGAAIAAILGEGAIVVTEGQRVLPERTMMAGYTFRFSEVGAALANLV
ncbi:MAG: TIGR01777 family oxidoreductase [Candidatus Eremiobacteraeota bacterium]|nr:TIGR01777 family oxidoreductase [Candidatus Eremiobacteraeota bacterium]